MGGPMSYQRFRNRNGLMRRSVNPSDPYSFSLEDRDWMQRFPQQRNDHILNGDLNRMEQDYLGDNYNRLTPEEFRSQHSCDLGLDVAKATGVDIEDVRKVMRYVFFEQR